MVRGSRFLGNDGEGKEAGEVSMEALLGQAGSVLREMLKGDVNDIDDLHNVLVDLIVRMQDLGLACTDRSPIMKMLAKLCTTAPAEFQAQLAELGGCLLEPARYVQSDTDDEAPGGGPGSRK